MLAGAGLGNHFLLAHELGQQGLAQAVVDLVGTRVVQVFALEMNLRAAQLVRQALGVKDGAGATHIVGKQRSQLVLKVLALHDFLVSGSNFVHALLQLWWHQLAAIGAKESLCIRHGLGTCGHVCLLGVNGCKAAFISQRSRWALAGKFKEGFHEICL